MFIESYKKNLRIKMANVNVYRSELPPSNPLDGTFWLEESTYELFVYVASIGQWIQVSGGVSNIPDGSITPSMLSSDIVETAGGLDLSSSGLKLSNTLTETIILYINAFTGVNLNQQQNHIDKSSHQYIEHGYYVNDRFKNLQDTYIWINKNINSINSVIHIVHETDIEETFNPHVVRTGPLGRAAPNDTTIYSNNAIGEINHWSLSYWNYVNGEADYVQNGLTKVILNQGSAFIDGGCPFWYQNNCAFHGIHFLFDGGDVGLHRNQALFLAVNCAVSFHYCKVTVRQNSQGSIPLKTIFKAENGGAIKVGANECGQFIVNRSTVYNAQNPNDHFYSFYQANVVNQYNVNIIDPFAMSSISNQLATDGRKQSLIDQITFPEFSSEWALDATERSSHALEIESSLVLFYSIFEASNHSVIDISEKRINYNSLLGTECSALHFSGRGQISFSYFVKMSNFSLFKSNTKFSQNPNLSFKGYSIAESNGYNSMEISSWVNTVPFNNVSIEQGASNLCAVPGKNPASGADKLYSKSTFSLSNQLVQDKDYFYN
jgi:hypothetical protein